MGKDISISCRNTAQSQFDIVTRDGGIFNESCVVFSFLIRRDSFGFMLSEVRCIPEEMTADEVLGIL